MLVIGTEGGERIPSQHQLHGVAGGWAKRGRERDTAEKVGTEIYRTKVTQTA